MKTNNSIESQLKQILLSVLDNEQQVENLKPEDHLVKSGINSLVFIKMIVAIEDQFEMEFADTDLNFGVISTFGDLISYIGLRSKAI